MFLSWQRNAEIGRCVTRDYEYDGSGEDSSDPIILIKTLVLCNLEKKMLPS